MLKLLWYKENIIIITKVIANNILLYYTKQKNYKYFPLTIKIIKIIIQIN